MKAFFIPLLALVAAYSCEAAFDTYMSLNTTDPTTNVLNKVNVTASLVDANGNVKPNNAKLVCPITDLQAGNSSCIPVSYDNDDYIMASFDTTNMTFAGGLEPEYVVTRACYSLVSSKLRKWRKFEDRFKRDKHCSINEGNVEAKKDFVRGPMTTIMKIPDHMPEAFFSIQLYVKCKGQGSNEWCAVSDTMRAKKMFFETKPIDSIDTKLTVITLIMAFVGPVFFFGWFVYDRFMKKIQ